MCWEGIEKQKCPNFILAYGKANKNCLKEISTPHKFFVKNVIAKSANLSACGNKANTGYIVRGKGNQNREHTMKCDNEAKTMCISCICICRWTK